MGNPFTEDGNRLPPGAKPWNPPTTPPDHGSVGKAQEVAALKEKALDSLATANKYLSEAAKAKTVGEMKFLTDAAGPALKSAEAIKAKVDKLKGGK